MTACGVPVADAFSQGVLVGFVISVIVLAMSALVSKRWDP